MPRDLVIIPTGAANIASVAAAFRRLDVESRLVASADDIRLASHVVLPGVGSFGAAMKRLSELNLVEALRSRIVESRPTFAVCVGLQLLARGSEESPGVAGLGIVDATVRRFARAPRIPQFGWNSVTTNGTASFLTNGYAYFANSYCLIQAPAGWTVAWSEYGGPFVAGMERGGVLACQFHPELSSDYGAGTIRRWLEQEAS